MDSVVVGDGVLSVVFLALSFVLELLSSPAFLASISLSDKLSMGGDALGVESTDACFAEVLSSSVFLASFSLSYKLSVGGDALDIASVDGFLAEALSSSVFLVSISLSDRLSIGDASGVTVAGAFFAEIEYAKTGVLAGADSVCAVVVAGVAVAPAGLVDVLNEEKVVGIDEIGGAAVIVLAEYAISGKAASAGVLYAVVWAVDGVAMSAGVLNVDGWVLMSDGAKGVEVLIGVRFVVPKAETN